MRSAGFSARKVLALVVWVAGGAGEEPTRGGPENGSGGGAGEARPSGEPSACCCVLLRCWECTLGHPDRQCRRCSPREVASCSVAVLSPQVLSLPESSACILGYAATRDYNTPRATEPHERFTPFQR